MAKVKKAMTKSELYKELAEKTELSKADVMKVMDAFVELLGAKLKGKEPPAVTLPGIARFKVRNIKAVKGGVKKTNPLTGLEYVTKDKPAYNKVSILPVKALKEMLK